MYFSVILVILLQDVGFEVHTAVVMKSTVFCDITPCTPFKINRRFAALLATCFYAGFLLLLFFDPEDGGYIFLQNVG
jgi:hypothetical protein